MALTYFLSNIFFFSLYKLHIHTQKNWLKVMTAWLLSVFMWSSRMHFVSQWCTLWICPSCCVSMYLAVSLKASVCFKQRVSDCRTESETPGPQTSFNVWRFFFFSIFFTQLPPTLLICTTDFHIMNTFKERLYGVICMLLNPLYNGKLFHPAFTFAFRCGHFVN